ncbi:hypothetical protein CTI12_AA385830 [Artemisia annua]|uniref:Uncharacterized protein n=1 Tax=Artemisia annua TaxID=35608 RepID=A0A2U1LDS9_ARTAN|nr:hypothetical protein CTI12_AA385830 [Artemisia annua]
MSNNHKRQLSTPSTSENHTNKNQKGLVTDLSTPNTDANICLSLNGGPSILNTPQSHMQLSQQEQNSALVSSSNTNTYGQAFISNTHKRQLSTTSVCENHIDKKRKGLVEYSQIYKPDDRTHVGDQFNVLVTPDILSQTSNNAKGFQSSNEIAHIHQPSVTKNKVKQVNRRKKTSMIPHGLCHNRDSQIQGSLTDGQMHEPENEGISNMYLDLGDSDYACKSNLNPAIVQSLMQILDEHNELVQVFRTARDKCRDSDMPEFKIQLYNVVGSRQHQLPSSGTLGAIAFQPDEKCQTDYDIVIEMTEAYIRDLRPTTRHKIIEAKVYRSWIARDVGEVTEKGYRAILLDKQGDAIQGNMEATERTRFTTTIIPGRAYRILGFTCIPTDNWQQTLENRTTLLFTRLTKFEPIPETGFPLHYFNFVAYNQLRYKVVDPLDKTKKEYPILTDYIGCYMGSGEKEKWGDPISKQIINRKVEIQSVNRDSVELTLWDELAETFKKEEIDQLEKPVIIADKEKEKTRNRIPLAQLLHESPKAYTGLTHNESGITHHVQPVHLKSILMKTSLDAECMVQLCLQLTNGTDTAMITFFSPKANDVVGIDCESLVKSLENPDPREFPEKILSIVGKKHIFQFHYNTSSKQETIDFIFNDILDKPDTPHQIADKPSGSQTTVQPNENIQINEPEQRQILPSIETTVPAETAMIKDVIPTTAGQSKYATQMATMATTSTVTQPPHDNLELTESMTQEPEVEPIQFDQPPMENRQLEETSTPPTLQTGMQTRSKTETTSDNTRKTTRRQLFTDEPFDNKKKKA